MGILTRFTLRSLARNRARTIATVVGIALSCALVTAIFTTVTSISGGLLQRTLEADGSWQLTSPRVSDHKLSELRANSHVTELVAGRELGSAKVSDEQATSAGTFITVKSLPVDLKGTATPTGTSGTASVGVTQLPQALEGRLPETADEIALPALLEGTTPDGVGISSDGPLAVGSTVTLELGDRVYTASDGTRTPLSSVDSYAAEDWSYTGTGGGMGGTEDLENLHTRTFTVTGFYSTGSGFWAYSGTYTGSAAGSVALSGPAAEGEDEGFAVPYLVTDFASYQDLDEWAALFFSTGVEFSRSTYANGSLTAVSLDSGGYVLHNDLLRYQGMTDDRAIWNTLWQLAVILAVVVVAASVSLIYTSFAISVTERMRQFGLLSGIGASRRQLRRSVLAEALALGVVGIPLGLAAGVGGTAVTLALTQSWFASILGTEGGTALAVDPRAITASALIALVTLLLSAWLPALRAGRVSAVDAIRQANAVREGRFARWRRHLPGGGPASWLASRLFGVSGLVAHRNLTRSSSRGRVVVVSLAASVALVVTCGAIDAYMQPVASVASMSADKASGKDVQVSLGTAYSEDAPSGGDELASNIDAFMSQASTIPGVSNGSYYLAGNLEGIVPAALVSDEMRAWAKDNAADDYSWTFNMPSGASYTGSSNPYLPSGDYAGTIMVYYIDDAAWDAWAQSLGAGAPASGDGPAAIAINRYRGNDGTRYVTDLRPFAATGTVTSYAFGDDPSSARIKGTANIGISEDPNGAPVMRFVKLTDSEDDFVYDEDGQPQQLEVPVSELATAQDGIQVVALADEVPDELAQDGVGTSSSPTLVMPIRELGAHAIRAGGTLSAWSGQASFDAEDDVAATRELQQLADTFNAETKGALSGNAYNLAENTRRNVDSASLIKLFMLLFSGITMLIALANVFNTLTSSIVLRTREFAVLRSAGMGERAFAAMIAYECASYAWRGLALGLAVAMGVSWLMWRSMQASFVAVGVAVPWPYIAAAAAGVLVVLALSVTYALHRVHAQNLIDALRRDAL